LGFSLTSQSQLYQLCEAVSGTGCAQLRSQKQASNRQQQQRAAKLCKQRERIPSGNGIHAHYKNSNYFILLLQKKEI